MSKEVSIKQIVSQLEQQDDQRQERSIIQSSPVNTSNSKQQYHTPRVFSPDFSKRVQYSDLNERQKSLFASIIKRFQQDLSSKPSLEQQQQNNPAQISKLPAIQGRLISQDEPIAKIQENGQNDPEYYVYKNENDWLKKFLRKKAQESHELNHKILQKEKLQIEYKSEIQRLNLHCQKIEQQLKLQNQSLKLTIKQIQSKTIQLQIQSGTHQLEKQEYEELRSKIQLLQTELTSKQKIQEEKISLQLIMTQMKNKIEKLQTELTQTVILRQKNTQENTEQFQKKIIELEIQISLKQKEIENRNLDKEELLRKNKELEQNMKILNQNNRKELFDVKQKEKTQIQFYSIKVQDFQTQIEMIKNQKIALSQINRVQKQQIQSLENSLNSRPQISQVTLRKIALMPAIEEQLKKAVVELDNIDSQNQNLKNINSNLEKEVDIYKKSLEEVQLNISQIQREFERQKSENQLLRKNAERHDEQIDELKKMYKQVQRQNKQINNARGILQQQLNSMINQYREIQYKSHEKQKQLRSRKQQISLLHSQIQIKKSSEQNRHKEELKIKDLGNKIANLEREKSLIENEWKKQIVQISTKYEDLSKKDKHKIQDMQKKIQILSKKNKTLEEQLKKSKISIENSDQERKLLIKKQNRQIQLLHQEQKHLIYKHDLQLQMKDHQLLKRQQRIQEYEQKGDFEVKIISGLKNTLNETKEMAGSSIRNKKLAEFFQLLKQLKNKFTQSQLKTFRERICFILS